MIRIPELITCFEVTAYGEDPAWAHMRFDLKCMRSAHNHARALIRCGEIANAKIIFAAAYRHLNNARIWRRIAREADLEAAAKRDARASKRWGEAIASLTGRTAA